MQGVREVQSPATDFEVSVGYKPGMIGRIAELHATYYDTHWGFGRHFEAKVAPQLSDFVLRYDEASDRLWTVRVNGAIEASLAIDGVEARAKGAHLRWFIASDTVRGRGAGAKLMHAAIKFCSECAYTSIYLWTFKGLEEARHLYNKSGFVVTEEIAGETWGQAVLEQKYELRL